MVKETMKPIMQGWVCPDDVDINRETIGEKGFLCPMSKTLRLLHCKCCTKGCKPLRVTVEREE